MRQASMIVILAVSFFTLVACGESGRPAAPEAGSMGDRMCDTNEIGPGTTRLGGKNYDEDCLDAYPWEAD